MEASAPIYRLLNDSSNNAALIIDIIISLISIIIESLANKQKGEVKKINPNMLDMDGLHKICRCPNYFGEILFWAGSFISDIGALQGGQWILASLGYALIVFIMFSSAKRNKTYHIKYYGDKKRI